MLAKLNKYTIFAVEISCGNFNLVVYTFHHRVKSYKKASDKPQPYSGFFCYIQQSTIGYSVSKRLQEQRSKVRALILLG